MTGESRSGRCWFCGQPHLREGDPVEHVIPAAIGGTLTTDRVARSCNNELGESIDKPFLDDFFIALERVFWDVRDPRRRQDRPPPNPQHTATLEDGTSVKVEMRDRPWRPILEPRLLHEDEKVFRITAPSVEAAKAMMEKKLERLKRDGIDVSEAKITEERKGDAEWVTISAGPDGKGIDGTIRVRAIAKMTLAALSLVLPDEWLDTPDAKRLIGWLRDEKPQTIDGKGTAIAVPTTIPERIKTICRPPEHLIFFTARGPDAVNILIFLFGTEALGQRIELDGAARPKIAWAMDPKALRCKETTFEQLTLRAVKALMEAEGQKFPGTVP